MEYVESEVVNNGDGGAAEIVLPVPTSVQDGDLLVMVVATRGGSGITVTTPGGWTALRNSNNGTTTRLATFYRFASAEPASYTVTLSGVAEAVGSISRWKDVKQMEFNGGISTGTSTTPTAGSVTLTSAYGLALAIYAHGTGDTFTTPPPGFSERCQGQSGAAVDTDRVTFALYEMIPRLAGATGTKQALVGNSAAWLGQQVAFTPDRTTDEVLKRTHGGTSRSYAG